MEESKGKTVEEIMAETLEQTKAIREMLAHHAPCPIALALERAEAELARCHETIGNLMKTKRKQEMQEA